MTKINGTSIALTRGDTLQVLVSILKDGEAYTPAEGDKVTFYLKHRKLTQDQTAYTDAEPLISREIPAATMTLVLAPSDTRALGFGEYVYDIEIEFSDGVTDTFINNAKFTLLPEVG